MYTHTFKQLISIGLICFGLFLSGYSQGSFIEEQSIPAFVNPDGNDWTVTLTVSNPNTQFQYSPGGIGQLTRTARLFCTLQPNCQSTPPQLCNCYVWDVFKDGNFIAQILPQTPAGSTLVFPVSASEPGVYKFFASYSFALSPTSTTLPNSVIFVDKSHEVTIGEVPCPEIAARHANNQSYLASGFSYSSDCDLDNNKVTSFRACDHIDLLPGFDSGAGAGTDFDASIFATSPNGCQGIFQPNRTAEPPVLTDYTIPQPSFQFYPNPTSDYFHISSSLLLDTEMKILVMNTKGQTIFQTSSPMDQSIKMNAREWPAGLYIVQLFWEDQMQSHKIIRQ